MILTFRFLSDEEEDFILDVNINHDQTFLELHQKIQQTLDYDASQMASFYTSNALWEKLDEVSVIDMGNEPPTKIMADVTIGELFNATKQHILYVFDHLNERLFFGSVTRVIDAEPPFELPTVSKFEGKIPPQFIDDDNILEPEYEDSYYDETDDDEFNENPDGFTDEINPDGYDYE